MFRGRGAAARAHEDSGVPRRPARHRDHRLRRRQQRPPAHGQKHRAGEDRDLRRRRGGAGLPQSAGNPRRPAREYLGHRSRRRGVGRPAGAHGPVEEHFAQKTSARTLADVIGGADIFLGLSAGGVLKPEMAARWRRSPSSWRWPIRRRKSCRTRRWPSPRRADLHRAARIFPTRSTMFCVSPTSFAARSMSAPPRSTRR